VKFLIKIKIFKLEFYKFKAMQIKKNNYLFFFLLGFSFLINSQNKRLDSLLNLSKEAKDTILIQTLNELSWEYKSSNIDTAFFYAKIALKKSLYLNHKKSIAESYNSIGSVYQTKSNSDSAIYYHQKSLKLKKDIKDSIGIADSYNNLGIILDKKGDYLKALQNYFEALKIYEQKAIKFDQVPAVLVNIGILYKKQKKYTKVLEYYERALTIYKENNYDIGTVITTGNIGAVFLKLGDYEKAIEYCTNARSMYSNLGYKNYVPYMNVNIADAEYGQKKYKTSIARYLNVINLFTEQNNLFELANAKIGISNPYIATKQYAKANSYLKEALGLSIKNNFKEFQVNALKQLSEVNAKSKNYKEAFQYQKLYFSKKDSLFEIKKTKDINEILVKYESSKKEKEIVQQKEQLLEQELEIKNRNLYAILLASALLISGVIFFGIYKKNQFKREQLQKEIDLKDALTTIKMQNRLQEQRLKISRDLHDNIGSQLTFIISSIDNLKFISKDTNTKLKDKLASISSFTSGTIYELRDTIWAMNKNTISVEDLHSRILSFIEKAKIAVPDIAFNVAYTIDKNTSFSSLIGMNLFRVIQEAINNAVKYADAKNIEIHFLKEHQNFVISVLDDGKGFNINTVDLGNGLSNMEKRMSEIDGQVSINSQLEKGTTIKLLVNLKNV
jgi:signal transduction histidine kinase